MKRIGYLFFSVLLLWVCFIETSCKKEHNNPANTDTTTHKTDTLSLEINQFIWSGLYSYYLWTDSVPNLSPTKFNSQAELDNFLIPYTDHEKLFNDLLYKVRDKWSWIVDDYTSLENQFQGITKSMGYEFGLVRLGSTNNIFGYVRYVVKGSPADRAGMKRGDLFMKVDDTQLTVDNYQGLLYGSDSYKLSFATITNNTISLNGKWVSLNAEEVQENPIYLDTIYDVNSTKIGYLVYNGFVSDYDIQLNNVFQYFKDQGVQQLILDLRYNPGGSSQTTTYLASMIYGTDVNKVLFKTQYNKYIVAYLLNNYGSGYFIEYFADSILVADQAPAILITSLNLSKLCVITTGSTASASEAIINGLKPYIQVTTVGSNTVGKYVGSMTLYDYDSNGVYDAAAGGKVNPNHKWAMQPIIMKVANSLGQSDYYNGFTPDFAISEYDYLDNLKPFGDSNEPLLQAAINNVLGLPQKKAFITSEYRGVADSRDLVPHSKEMYLNPAALRKHLPLNRKPQFHVPGKNR